MFTMGGTRRRYTRVTIAAIVVLLAVYIGTYFVCLKPPPQGYNDLLDRRWSSYRYGAGFAEIVFWPIEQIDRQLRPGTWTLPTETTSP
jgi:hypothetical protein